ncbi:hypothetical protein C8Q78DRAFT_322333 [Trametes maxima]|nr:hypothetical protein C8Q78DRAFT_322333 [Trametes maxima]
MTCRAAVCTHSPCFSRSIDSSVAHNCAIFISSRARPPRFLRPTSATYMYYGQESRLRNTVPRVGPGLAFRTARSTLALHPTPGPSRFFIDELMDARRPARTAGTRRRNGRRRACPASQSPSRPPRPTHGRSANPLPQCMKAECNVGVRINEHSNHEFLRTPVWSSIHRHIQRPAPACAPAIHSAQATAPARGGRPRIRRGEPGTSPSRCTGLYPGARARASRARLPITESVLGFARPRAIGVVDVAFGADGEGRGTMA